MLTIRCQCGEVFHAEERHIGRAIKCGRCGQILSIGAQLPTPTDPAFVEKPPPEAHVTSGRRWKRRWGVAFIVLTAVASTVMLAMLFFPREQETQQRVTGASGTQPLPAAISEPVPTSKPAPLLAPITVADLDALDAASKPVQAPPAPQTQKRPATRLQTGANIWPPLRAPGRGTLQIHNGTTYDAAVTLLDAEAATARRYVYLRARDMTTLTDIAPCRCRLFFALGTDWDAGTEEFRENASFAVFDDFLQFTESETERGVEWATFSVTLHAVPEGRARTTRLSKQEFAKQLGQPARSRTGV